MPIDRDSIDVPSELRRLWRDARNSGWTRAPIRLTLGWRAVDAARHRALEQLVLKEPAWSASPADEYEPECDPLELIVYTIVREPSLAEIEERVAHMRRITRGPGSHVNRIGLGMTCEAPLDDD